MLCKRGQYFKCFYPMIFIKRFLKTHSLCCFIENTMNVSCFKGFYNLIFKMYFKRGYFKKSFQKPSDGAKTLKNHSIISKHH